MKQTQFNAPVSEKEKEREDILHSNMWSLMYRLSWPTVIAMVLYGLNTVFDAIFVGHFVGSTALAGVSLAYPLTQVTFGFGALIGSGAGAALSIAIGAKDGDTQRRMLPAFNFLLIIISLVITILTVIFAKHLVQMMGGSGEALTLGANYFRTTAYGSLVFIAGLGVNMTIRGEGRMKKAAWMMGAGLIANIVCNYIFVVLLDMGVEGAAWGTNVGMFVYSLLGYLYFASGKTSFEAVPFKISSDQSTCKLIVKMGMPTMIMTIMGFVQGVIIFNTLSVIGIDTDIAFYGATYRIMTFLLTPVFGLMRALQPVLGINHGAQNYARVQSAFWIFTKACVLMMFPFWIMAMFMPELCLSLMLPSSTFTTTNLTYFKVSMSIIPLLPVIFMALTLFQSVGKGSIASILGLARQVVLYMPVMYFMPRLFGIHWIYWGSAAIDGFMVIIGLILVANYFKQPKLTPNTNATSS